MQGKKKALKASAGYPPKFGEAVVELVARGPPRSICSWLGTQSDEAGPPSWTLVTALLQEMIDWCNGRIREHVSLESLFEVMQKPQTSGPFVRKKRRTKGFMQRTAKRMRIRQPLDGDMGLAEVQQFNGDAQLQHLDDDIIEDAHELTDTMLDSDSQADTLYLAQNIGAQPTQPHLTSQSDCSQTSIPAGSQTHLSLVAFAAAARGSCERQAGQPQHHITH